MINKKKTIECVLNFVHCTQQNLRRMPKAVLFGSKIGTSKHIDTEVREIA